MPTTVSRWAGGSAFLRLRRQKNRKVKLLALRTHTITTPNSVRGSNESAVVDHPYRERLWFLLISALAMDGRRVDALRSYQRLCGILAEAGLAPSQDLQELEQEVLMETPKLRAHLAR